MLPIHCHAWICLYNATLECASPANTFRQKTANEKNFLSIQQNQKTEQHFYNEDKNKKVPFQIKMHLKNITKIEKYKNHPKYKVSKNKHTTDKDKNNQIHSQIKIHLNSINEIGKYKKLNMTEHKTGK